MMYTHEKVMPNSLPFPSPLLSSPPHGQASPYPTLPKVRVQRMSPSHPPGGRWGERPISHGHSGGLLLLVNLNLLHLLLYLLKLHLLLPLLGQLLHLGHPHGRLLLLAVVVSVDRVSLCRVGTVLCLRGRIQRHDRVLHVLFCLLRYEARI